MQKILFDKEIVNNQLSVLNNTLASQRKTKKTLLSHLEKFSDAIYENFNSESTDSLLSLINEAHLIFECIKSNINKTLELKSFLENIYNSTFLNTIDTEKFNNDFNSLLEDISKTNSSYLTFMNNYETFIKSTSIDESIVIDKDNKDDENAKINSLNSEESIETLNEDIIEDVAEDVAEDITEDIAEEESLFETINETVTSTIEEKAQENIPTDNPESTIDSEENIVKPVIVEENNENPEKELEETQKKEIKETPKRKYKDFTIIDTPENELEESLKESFVENVKSSTDLHEKELIINKSLGIAVLPYSASDLDEVFLDDPEKYSSIQDIIEQQYTVELKNFENTSFARYKEAFKLAKEKSNYTFSQAANFAKKFLVENEITTLIIASCKTVEELEFYIECLNNNKLQDFHYFKIIEK